MHPSDSTDVSLARKSRQIRALTVRTPGCRDRTDGSDNARLAPAEAAKVKEQVLQRRLATQNATTRHRDGVERQNGRSGDRSAVLMALESLYGDSRAQPAFSESPGSPLIPEVRISLTRASLAITH